MSLLAPLDSQWIPFGSPKDILAPQLIYSWFPMGVLMLPFGRHVLYGLLLVCAWHIGCARADVLFAP